jgi:hypothetical protein
MRWKAGPPTCGCAAWTDGSVLAVPLLGPLSPLRGPPTAPGACAYTPSGHWQGIDVQPAAAPGGHRRGLVLAREPAQHPGGDADAGPGAGARHRPGALCRDAAQRVLRQPLRGPRAADPPARVRCWPRARTWPWPGRHPWAMVGSLRRGARRATDACRCWAWTCAAAACRGHQQGLPGPRLQHEHALMAIQDEAITLAAGGRIAAGFFGRVLDDHPQATGAADLALADSTLALPEAAQAPACAGGQPAARSRRTARAFAVCHGALATHAWTWRRPNSIDPLRQHAPPCRNRCRHAAELFPRRTGHVVLRAKEQRVQRPHGHILRSGLHLVPDETALTSTVWMAGVFHSMVTQGHVSINRFLTTVRGMLGQFRAQGQRVFVRGMAPGASWVCLRPSRSNPRPAAGCTAMGTAAAGACRGAPCTARADAGSERIAGAAGPLMVTHQVALGGDEGSVGAPLHPMLQPLEGGVWVGVPAGSELAAAFRRAALPSADGRHGVRTDRRRRVSASGRPGPRPALGLRHRHGRPTIRPAHRGPPADAATAPRHSPPRCRAGPWPARVRWRRRCSSWPTSRPGTTTTRWCTTWRRAGWSSFPAAAGARATSARARWKCCWRWTARRRCATCCCVSLPRRTGWRLAAVVHVLRARPPHPRGRLARRHRLLAAAGAGALPAGQRRPGLAGRAGAVLRGRGGAGRSGQRLAARAARAGGDPRAAHSRHAPGGLWPWRLERFAAAGRARAARTPVQRLDRDPAPPDAAHAGALRCRAAARTRSIALQAEAACRAGGLPAPAGGRRRGHRLRAVPARSRRRAARALPAAPAGRTHRRALQPAAHDARHPGRHAQPRTGRGACAADRAAPARAPMARACSTARCPTAAGR